MEATFSSSTPSANSVEVSLISGVEICLGGEYAGICDVGWNDRAARVACNQFGYTDGELIHSQLLYVMYLCKYLI